MKFGYKVKVCPRCGSQDCKDPDSKQCSDNVIATLSKKLALAMERIPRPMPVPKKTWLEILLDIAKRNK